MIGEKAKTKHVGIKQSVLSACGFQTVLTTYGLGPVCSSSVGERVTARTSGIERRFRGNLAGEVVSKLELQEMLCKRLRRERRKKDQ